MLALIAVTTTIVVFAIPPLARQTQELVRSTPNVWQGIRTRIESLTQNYPEVREALPRTDEIARKVGGGRRNSWEHFATIDDLVWSAAWPALYSPSCCLSLCWLIPRPLVAAYLALAPDRYREQAHRTLARLMRQMTAWARGVAINGVITGLSIGVLLWLIGVQPALIFGVFAFLGEFLPNIGAFLVSIPILLVAVEPGRDKILAGARRDRDGLPGRVERSCAGRARQRDAIASGQHFVFYPGDRDSCSGCWEFFSLSPLPRWCRS